MNEKNDDGPAQIRAMKAENLRARMQFTYMCVRKNQGNGEVKRAMFPYRAAKVVCDAPDMLPNLRHLAGVVHSPVFRPDGTLITEPGYDDATRLLYLPEPDLEVPDVPERPRDADIKWAVSLLLEMIAEFPFDSDHDRANYLGMQLTPVLRSITPPPYKMGAIEAHQRGSGKTLLANLLRIVHGGVFRSEIPAEESELRKQITSVLSVTTGPVVVMDNVTGKLTSSTLAGLLTSAVWDDRPLGSTSWVQCRNDRLWVITGNNLNIARDLPRRTVRSSIDPGVPRPEERTGFAIADPEGWARARRGELLAAFLVLVRAWVVAGWELGPERSSDGYALWSRTVDGILQNAGIDGLFDHAETRIEASRDDEDWHDFLAAVHEQFYDGPWTVRQMLRTLPTDALPAELADKASRSLNGAASISKSLGRWIANRERQWAGDFTVTQDGFGADGKTKRWRIAVNRGESV